MTDREQRLESHLQAMSALNRQLHAQLGGARRNSIADDWLEQIAYSSGGIDATIFRGADGTPFVVEGDTRRRIGSNLLTAALTERLGHARWVSDAELERYSEGPPVEVLEGPYGPPFVIVGGRRLPVQGLPLPHPVSGDQMQMFSQGAAINVAAANVPRAHLRVQVDRVASVMTRKGGLAPTARAAREAVRRRLQRLTRRRSS